jgi:hypothetical protein
VSGARRGLAWALVLAPCAGCAGPVADTSGNVGAGSGAREATALPVGVT